MTYLKDVLKHIDSTGDINISIVDLADISTENTQLLTQHNIGTIKELSETPIEDLTNIEHLDISNIMTFFDRLSNLSYISDGQFILNNKGKNYIS